ncbi:MAG: hypothetical protein JNM99_20480 [Verrucomicrobiaceae bacterium]|nr:hypothetical protein [Verrucomicrobiaceae bacterium]
MKTRLPIPRLSIRKLTQGLGLAVYLLGASSLSAQTSYTAVDLTTSASGAAQAASGGQAAGYTGSVPNAFTGRATLWTGDGATDLHPSFLDGTGARSVVLGFAGNLQVGSGAGASTGNRNVPLAWHDTAASATMLSIPFTNAGGQANATDGLQIVGSAIGLTRDGTTLGSAHAVIWDVASGTATDIGTDANLYDVASGQQVGMVQKGIANAALWRGTKAYTLLHPKGAVVSVANGTDGFRQVGYAGFDIRVRVEAVKGAKDKRFNYAHVWTGTAASALNIHPYASNADGALFEHSFATKVAGPYIAGYVNVPSKINTPAYNRAVVWDASFQAIDLNAYLPAGFIGSQALDVDAEGNVAGVMTKADGTRHAVLWIPNP